MRVYYMKIKKMYVFKSKKLFIIILPLFQAGGIKKKSIKLMYTQRGDERRRAENVYSS